MALRCSQVLGIVLLLVGCATPVQTPYQPLAPNGGFSEQQIEPNRFRISFVGNSVTTREEVENYLLYRIADLTIAQGFDYFLLSERDTDANTYYLQTYTGYDTFDPFYPRYWPHTSFATGSATPITNYKAQAYVLLFKGTKPEAEPAAYDAREVKNNLGPLIQRNAAPP